jgi:GNAT superfamily N-acetyltransferase
VPSDRDHAEDRPGVEFTAVTWQLAGGRRVTVRAVRPDDRERLQCAVRGLSDDSRYSRFMSFMRELSPALLDQATQPAAERELQLVAVAGDGDEATIVGGARYSAAAGSRTCEFAVALADDWHRLGLARRLLEALIDSARARGFEQMEGYILAANSSMLGLARRLGFTPVEYPEDPTVRRVRRDLTRVAPPARPRRRA